MHKPAHLQVILGILLHTGFTGGERINRHLFMSFRRNPKKEDMALLELYDDEEF